MAPQAHATRTSRVHGRHAPGWQPALQRWLPHLSNRPHSCSIKQEMRLANPDRPQLDERHTLFRRISAKHHQNPDSPPYQRLAAGIAQQGGKQDRATSWHGGQSPSQQRRRQPCRPQLRTLEHLRWQRRPSQQGTSFCRCPHAHSLACGNIPSGCLNWFLAVRNHSLGCWILRLCAHTY